MKLLPLLCGARPVWLAVLLITTHACPAHAHVPVPDSVLHPASAAEAWNVLRLATANAERLLREDRLAEIPNQVSLCNPALRALPTFGVPAGRKPAVAAGAVRASITINSLAQGAVAGDAQLVRLSLDTLTANLRDLAASFAPAEVQADIFVCPMHPDCVSADRDARCSKCGMPLLPRRIPYSFVYTAPGQATLRLSATTAAPLIVGQPNRVTIQLNHPDGSPVRPDELLVVHTQPIHLLVIDQSLGDYHHEHPAPTENPGASVFSFTPATAGPYRIFADVVPADTGVQEYPFVDLPETLSFKTVLPNKIVETTATVDNLVFRLDWGEAGASAPRAGQPQILRLTISTLDGKPFTRLEPVMAAYAHLVGFYDDGITVVHLHPAGDDANTPESRGGPTLSFKFYPPKGGFLRLYCQVQINGQQVFAPFSADITP